MSIALTSALAVVMRLFEGETGTADLASIISAITSVFTAAIGWVATVASTIASTPLLLIGVIVSFVGLGVGLFRRLMNV